MASNNGAIKLVAGNSNPALAEAIGGYLGTPLTKASCGASPTWRSSSRSRRTCAAPTSS